MCEALGTEPIPEEIPLDSSDMSYETIDAVECYRLLPDNFTGMGDYLGKDMSNLVNVFKLLNIPEHEKFYIIETIQYMDSLVIKDLTRKRKAQEASSKRAKHG